MTNKKKSKSVVKSEERKEENVTPRPKSAPVERVISFDAYFNLLKAQGKAYAHHKAPMRKHAESNGLKEGTLPEFEKLFKSY